MQVNLYQATKSLMDDALAAYEKEQARLIALNVDPRERRRLLEPFLLAWQTAEFNFQNVRRISFQNTLAELEEGRVEKLSASDASTRAPASLGNILLEDRFLQFRRDCAKRGESFGRAAETAGFGHVVEAINSHLEFISELRQKS